MNATTIEITVFHDEDKNPKAGIDRFVEGIQMEDGIRSATFSADTVEDFEDLVGEDANKAIKAGLPVWTVSGYYVDNYQSYSTYVFATSPEQAVRKTFENLAEDLGTDLLKGTGLSYEESPLEEIQLEVGLEITSIVQGIPEERIFETPLG